MTGSMMNIMISDHWINDEHHNYIVITGSMMNHVTLAEISGLSGIVAPVHMVISVARTLQ